MRLVVLRNPLWIQRETSVWNGSEYEVSMFGIGKNTRCELDGVEISPSVVLEGSRYGLYKCLVNREGVEFKSMVYKDKDDVLGAVLFSAAVVVSVICIIGSIENVPR
jgi:hypothetical protein